MAQLTYLAGNKGRFSDKSGRKTANYPVIRREMVLLILLFITFFCADIVTAVTSDDFNTVSLDTSLWTLIDPVGDAQLTMTGKQASISVPAGTSHDVWSTGNFAPRIMQTVADTDFEIEVKFESSFINARYQLQGLLVEQNAGNFLRFDFYSNGSSTRLFAASFSDGTPYVKKNVSIGSVGAPLYMRISRQGDQWTQGYSTDGVNWTTGAVFSRSLSVTEVGVFAGNAGSSAPAHTAIIDYFFNTASPIIPEDGETLHTLTVNVSGSGSVAKNPDQTSYTAGDTVELTAVPTTGWTFDGWSGDAAGFENPTTVTVNSDLVIGAAFVQGPAVEYELDITTTGMGQVVLNPPGGTYTEGTTVELTAVGDPGWQFSGWSGDLTGSANPTSIVMTQNYAVNAAFDTDASAPVISNIAVNPSQNLATVTWTTDEPTTGVLDYGETTSYELGSVTDTGLVQNHSVSLANLTPGTSYHLQITAVDDSGNETTSADVIFATPIDPADIVSDDFNAAVLNTGLWTFVDPVGDGQLVMTGTQASISVPAGTSHDVWSSGNFAPRIMQAVADTDFEIEVKFESSVTLPYQLQGLLVEQNAGNFIRLDFYSNGSATKVFAATFTNGSPSVKRNISVNLSGSNLYMRLKRQGNTWTQSYSDDGVNWQTAATFAHALAVSSVGVFAGNAGSSAPAHTAVVDYFFNTASPIIPEDGETLNTLTVNVSGSGSVAKNPDQTSYTAGNTVELTAVAATGWTFDGWSGDAAGFENPTTVTVNSDLVIGAAFVQGPAVEYELDITTTGMGQVVLNPPGGTYTEGTTVELTAVGDPGWQFSGWSGDLTGSANPTSIVMTQNYAVNAAFDTDASAPVISNIAVNPSQNLATVTWTTDEPTTGVLDYGETTSYELGSVTDTGLVQNHSVSLANLTPGTSYHLQITAVDDSGNETTSADVIFATPIDPADIVSDDFNAAVLNTGLWTFVDPVGDGQLVMTGTQASISVPAGTSHDVWTSGIFAPRIMQAVADTDFEIEVKFESSFINARYQLQGLLVEQNAGNFLRFDFYSDGSSTRLFAASFSDGTPYVKKNVSIGSVGAPLYMRISRQGDQWTQGYSTDGVNWTTGAVFSRSLSVTEVGVFAGNAGSSAPAHTAIIDYFFNTASPIIPEDGETLHTLTVNVSGNGSVAKNPDQTAYTAGDTVELTAVAATGWTFDGWSGDVAGFENPTTVTVNSDLVIGAAFVQGPTVEYVLDVTTTGMGQVVLNPPGGTYNEGTTVTLTAVGDSGWQFSSWSGDLTGSTNPANLIMTQDYGVTATFETDTTAPVISNISVDASETSATISWSTDEPTAGVVDYGETTSYELGSVTDTSLVQNHTVTLTGLVPETSYHLQITATDNSGNETTSSDVVFSATADVSGIESDDFNAGVLDTVLWEFVDPKGDGQLVMTGTQLEISVPAGVSHDVWTSGNFAPRVMQAAADTDFEIEVKFESGVSGRYQLQGLLVEEDVGDFLRFDFFSDGSSTRLFAASFSGGTPYVKKNVSIGSVGAPLYMRISRQGDQWTQGYSTDGVNWTTGVVFSRSLSVTEVGVFAGNAGASPAHTAVVDYFFNTASPIIPEDGETLHTLTVNVTGSGSVTKTPDKTAYTPGDTVQLTAVPAAGWTFDGWSGDVVGLENPITVTVDSDMVVDVNFALGPAIEYTLDVTMTGSGQVMLNPSGGIYTEGSTVELTAVGDPGWQFSGWSGDLSGSTNPANLIMTQNYAITATFETDTTAPVISNISVDANETSATISWSTDEPTAGVVDYGETTSYELGSVTDTSLVQNHTVTLTGLVPETSYHLQITATDNSGNETTSSDVVFSTTADPSDPIVDIWYGPHQVFGEVGIPQRWVNILGNVSDPDGIATLTYSLNSGPESPLSVGPDNPRLVKKGDFNVEIAFVDLTPGLNQLIITATDNYGKQTSEAVDVELVEGNEWPKTYNIDWTSVGKIQDVAQIVDGLWAVDGEVIRPVITGYDRLVAIGDITWDDYEIEVPVIIHEEPSFWGPGVGIVMRWDGHHDWGGSQPTIGWHPLGALGWYRFFPESDGGDRLMMIGHSGTIVAEDTSGRKLDINMKYILKMRVETIPNIGARYSLKVWEDGQPEPAAWDLVANEDFSSPQKGSLLLLAHQIDVSFGNVSIAPVNND